MINRLREYVPAIIASIIAKFEQILCERFRNILKRSFKHHKNGEIACYPHNRPFPSSKKFHFQNEAKCETFVVEMSSICIIIKTHFHNKGFALSLVLKVKLVGTRKWPIS